MEVLIEEMCDGFAITLLEDGNAVEAYHFDQEDSIKGLAEVFKVMGCSPVKYTEVY